MKFWRSRKQFEDDMDAELRFHLESYTADLIRSGLDPETAKRRAGIEFGTVTAKKDECREAWGLRWLDELRADLRLTLRTLRQNPGFAAIGILSLALGIGATTAIFGVLDAVMLRLLPVRDPEQLVFVHAAGTAGRDGPPYPFFELLRDRSSSFEALAAFSPSAMELSAGRGRELAKGVWVSANFYETLGVRALLGRTLTSSDNQTAVISERFWRQRFAGDPAVLGRVIQVFQHSLTIVGVMPSEIMSLEPGSPVDIAAPMALSDPAMMRDRTSLWLDVAGRLKPGVSLERARAEADGLFHGYMATAPPLPAQIRKMLYQRIELRPAGQGLGGLRSRFSKPLAALMVLAAMVLLAACVNMANLLMARTVVRQRDFAVRLALGAGRGRLIRQTLTESLVLSGAGALLGIVLARIGETLLAAFFADGNNQLVLDLSLDFRLLMFSAAVAVLSGMALGVVPALRAARVDPAVGLEGGSRGVRGNRGSIRFGRALVVVQVALSLVMLAGAGLFVRSLEELKSIDLGFRREGILTMEVTPERRLFGTSEWLGIQNDVIERVRQIPGVQAAGWATMTPLSGRDRGALVEVPGLIPRAETDKHIHLAAISPGYFEALGVPVRLGRSFTARDNETAPKVAVVNESAARFYFGGANPMGRKIRLTNYPSRELIYQVAGVVKDSKHDDLREEAARFIYLPIPQSADRINRLALTIRCSGDPIAIAPSVRQQVSAERSPLLITNVTTMERQVAQTLLRERLVAALSATFGTVALVLSCIGLYGILAYTVTRRTNEIGIRVALGARRIEVVWLFLKEGLGLATGGIVIGLAAVLALGNLTKTLRYGVEPFDPLVLAGAALALLAFAALAAAGPSRRASLLDLIAALRRE